MLDPSISLRLTILEKKLFQSNCPWSSSWSPFSNHHLHRHSSNWLQHLILDPKFSFRSHAFYHKAHHKDCYFQPLYHLTTSLLHLPSFMHLVFLVDFQSTLDWPFCKREVDQAHLNASNIQVLFNHNSMPATTIGSLSSNIITLKLPQSFFQIPSLCIFYFSFIRFSSTPSELILSFNFGPQLYQV